MIRRMFVFIAAALIAASLLAVTFMTGQDDTSSRQGPSDLDDLLDVNTNLTLTPQGDISSGLPVDQTDRGEFTRVEDDMITRVTWDRAKPLPQGVSEVERPDARVFFRGGSVLQIKAETGRFVAPDRQPTSGLFRGNVIVTLYRSQDDQPIDFDSDRDINIRVFLKDEARFDLVINQIETDGDVFLTGPRVEFAGQGLILTYNQALGRLERLEIEHGDMLRFASKEAPVLVVEDVEVVSTENNDTNGESAEPTVEETLAEATEAEPQADTDSNTATDKTADEASKPARATLANASPDDDNEQTRDDPSEVAQADGPRPTFYRAQFEDSVEIAEATQDARLSGELFEMIFAMEDASPVTQAMRHPTPPEAPEVTDTTDVQDALDASVRSPFPEDVQSNPFAHWPLWVQAFPKSAIPRLGPSLFDEGNQQVEVRWIGRLVVEPELTAAVELQTAEDVAMRLTGRPARVWDKDNRELTAVEIAYEGATGIVTAIGNPARPVIIDSPGVGEMRGERLLVNQTTGLGEMVGKGRLLTAETNETSEDDQASARQTPLEVTWQQRMDFALVTKPVDDDEPEMIDAGVGRMRSAALIGALEWAEFRGDTEVRHTDLSLDADRFRLSFAEVDPSVDTEIESIPESLDAEGDVVMTLRDRQSETLEEAQIKGQRVQIELGHDEQGEVWPTRLIASDQAVLQREQTILAGNRIDARFKRLPSLATTEPPEAPEVSETAEVSETTDTPEALEIAEASELTAEISATDNTTADDDPLALASADIELTNLVATGQVRLELTATDLQQGVTSNAETSTTPTTLDDTSSDDPPTVLTGDRLIVNPASEIAELFGTAEQFASAQQGGRLIEGQHLILNQQKQSLLVQGSGRLSAQESEDHAAKLEINWNEAMQFDQASQMARFTGEVKAVAESDEETSTLSAPSMAIQLADPEERKANRDKPAGDIRQVTAQGGAILVSETKATLEDGRPLTRLYMAGPVISFDNLPSENLEQVQVIGEGSLQLEDYRTKEQQDSDKNRTASNDQSNTTNALQDGLDGRGITLLLWEKQLVLDVTQNNMTADKNVMVLHRPMADESAPADAKPDMIQLDTQQLIVDLQDTGGLGAWLGDNPPEPSLDTVQANGSVRVLRGARLVTSDHMRYLRNVDAIRFWSDEGRWVRAEEDGRAVHPAARSVLWYLSENRFQAFDVVGSGQVDR